MSLTFLIREPGGAERRVEVEPGATFGRHPSNTCVLGDPTAGTWQARVAERGGELVLEDMGSRNGTRVVDGPLLGQGQCARLVRGARFLLGATLLEVTRARARDAAALCVDTDESAYLGTVVHAGGALEGDRDADVRFQRALADLRPRLVIADGVRAKIVDLERPETAIGRTGADVRIEHLSVSSPHARIRFDGVLGRFFVEDQGSANGSFLAEEVLLPGQERELLPETHLRFGDVHTLWVAEAFPDGSPIAAGRRERALALLVRDGELSAVQHKSALSDAALQGRHPGEILVLRGVLGPGSWVKAFRRAEFARDTIEIEKRWLVVACVLVALALALLFVV